MIIVSPSSPSHLMRLASGPSVGGTPPAMTKKRGKRAGWPDKGCVMIPIYTGLPQKYSSLLFFLSDINNMSQVNIAPTALYVVLFKEGSFVKVDVSSPHRECRNCQLSNR